MNKIFKILLKTMALLLGLLVVFVLGIAFFMFTAPQFGASMSDEVLEKHKKSSNYSQGVFQNQVKTEMNMKAGDMVKLMGDFLFNGTVGAPNSPLPANFGEGDLSTIDSLVFVTWYGHSAILLEMEGKKILIDPMLGPASAPVSFTTKRFEYSEPIPIDDLKNIDAVILSHDHYDHLDYPTILKIKDEVAHFYTALGVGEHLKKWGVATEKISQLDWWESTKLGNIELIAAPARHFSGRGVGDRNKTQWASWVIKGEKNNIYFSGDGGYADHFKDIGNKYGPFDFAMVECGQYNELWAQIHMMPEETVQASVDIKAKLMMPIHWGAFKLAPHDWKDPIIRVLAEGEKQGLKITTPVIGERFSIQKYPHWEWWRSVN